MVMMTNGYFSHSSNSYFVFFFSLLTVYDCIDCNYTVTLNSNDKQINKFKIKQMSIGIKRFFFFYTFRVYEYKNKSLFT